MPSKHIPPHENKAFVMGTLGMYLFIVLLLSTCIKRLSNELFRI